MSSPKIVIVGAGAVGLFCGLRLAERGADVTVIDGDAPPPGGASASLAAAGMLSPIAEALTEPETAHPQRRDLALASFDLWRAASAPLAAHARFEGALVLGPNVEALKREMEALGRRHDMMTRAAIGSRFRVDPADVEGLYVADDGVIDPPAMLAALKDALTAIGGRVLYDIEAEAIIQKPWRRVRCLGGELLSADHVVIAPGVWARDSLFDIAPALKLVRPAKGALAEVVLESDAPINIRGPGFYLAPRSGGEAVLGATMEFDTFDRRADAHKVDALLEAVERALPQQVRRTARPPWAGVRPMSPDWSPMIGLNGEPGILVAAGHSRNGWLLAPVTAAIISAYVFGEEIAPLWAAFSPERFET